MCLKIEYDLSHQKMLCCNCLFKSELHVYTENETGLYIAHLCPGGTEESSLMITGHTVRDGDTDHVHADSSCAAAQGLP